MNCEPRSQLFWEWPEQIKKDPERHLDEGLEMIERNGGKLLDMTNKLLDLSRMEAKMMPVNWIQQDIVAYVKYLVESFHSYARSRGIELSYEISEKKLMMDFDMDKIADILSNLISNAIKFTPAGGKVIVTLYQQKTDGSDHLHIQVKDNGPGIPEEDQARVFQRYFQAQRHEDQYTEGSGLGLAVTREMVQLLRGTISVTSELNKGSTFIVILPITNRAEFESSSKEGEYQQMHSGLQDIRLRPDKGAVESSNRDHQDKCLRLLVVEDSKDVASYLGSLLSEHYRIDNAWNGAQGLEMAVRIVPDLIISDVMMPVMDGFSMCQRLKKDMRTSHVPIIMLTARNEASSRMEGLKSGADAYLGKPFNKEELFVRVNKLIELRQHLRESYRRMAADPALVTQRQVVDEQSHSNDLEYTFLQTVAQVLEENLSDDEFGVQELCQTLGMSRSQLYRKFSALTDTSVNQFIQNLRLNKARLLLRSSDLNVSEVAYDTGFKNPSHFSRLYASRFGIPPSKEERKELV